MVSGIDSLWDAEMRTLTSARISGGAAEARCRESTRARDVGSFILVGMTNQPMMQAIGIERHGGAEALTPIALPRPVPGPRDVLVRVLASSVNPADLRARRPEAGSRAIPRRFPLVLGYDLSGLVIEAGPDVTRFAPGDEVFGSPSPLGQGAHAELVAVDERLLAHKPPSLSHAEAGVAPLVCLTAWRALFERARVEPGQTVLVHGGAGGVGHVAIQLAKLHGCRVVATAGRTASIETCRRLGADEVIDHGQEDFVSRALQISNSRGVDVVLDTVGGTTLARSTLCLRPLGQLVTIVPSDFHGEAQAAFMRSVSVHYEMMWTRCIADYEPERLGNALAVLAGLLDRRAIRVLIHRVFPLSELSTAHRLQEAGGFQGKLGIRVSPA